MARPRVGGLGQGSVWLLSPYGDSTARRVPTPFGASSSACCSSPLLGTAVGAGVGALAGHFADTGIDRDFIRSVQDRVTPGTSALFLLSDHAALGRVELEFKGIYPELISTNLSDEQEQRLREAFSEG
jgi:uncharacterized membrane protein